jgi:PIN domain nuclease of toxin-antitoxin system
MPSAVLDSSAVLAVLNGEPGAEIVAAVLATALVSAVNAAEVVGKLVDKGVTIDHAESALSGVGLDVVEFDFALALRAGALRAQRANRHLSLGDRACLALAERERVPAMTSDRSWAGAVADAEIQLIR